VWIKRFTYVLLDSHRRLRNDSFFNILDVCDKWRLVAEHFELTTGLLISHGINATADLFARFEPLAVLRILGFLQRHAAPGY